MFINLYVWNNLFNCNLVNLLLYLKKVIVDKSKLSFNKTIRKFIVIICKKMC